MFAKQPWGRILIVFVLTAVLVAALHDTGGLVPRLLLGVIAAFATCAGALLSPASYSAAPLPRREYQLRKTWQVAVAGAVTVIFAAVLTFNSGVGAIFGIAAAIMLGAVLPRSEQGSRVDEPV